MSLHRLVFIVCIVWAGMGITAECPPGPNQVSVRIVPSVQQNPVTGQYVYDYVVKSLPSSLQEVDRFALDHVGELSAIHQPEGWRGGEYINRDPAATRKVWGFSAFKVAEPHRIRDDASVPPSIVQIKPGDSLAGFGFSSDNPPGPVRYYVAGFIDLPVQVADDPAEAEMQAEILMEECPEISQPILQQAVTGITAGPVEANFTPVSLDIKPGNFPNAVNPRSRGVIPVALLGSSAFDVTQVDQASLRFGPGSAQIRHMQEHFEDINKDGLTDLLLHFSTSDTRIDCGDGVAFLQGRTLTGEPIQGFDSIQPVSCR